MHYTFYLAVYALCFKLCTLYLYFIVRSERSDTNANTFFFFFFFFLRFKKFFAHVNLDGFDSFLWEIVFNERYCQCNIMYIYSKSFQWSREQSLYLYLELLWNEENLYLKNKLCQRCSSREYVSCQVELFLFGKIVVLLEHHNKVHS